MTPPRPPRWQCDHACRDLMWRTVLDLVHHGPQGLGRVVAGVEAAIADCPHHQSLSACLQEMARNGQIHIECDGRRWSVRLGPAGRETLARLQPEKSLDRNDSAHENAATS